MFLSVDQNVYIRFQSKKERLYVAATKKRKKRINHSKLYTNHVS